MAAVSLSLPARRRPRSAIASSSSVTSSSRAAPYWLPMSALSSSPSPSALAMADPPEIGDYRPQLFVRSSSGPWPLAGDEHPLARRLGGRSQGRFGDTAPWPRPSACCASRSDTHSSGSDWLMHKRGTQSILFGI